MPKPTTLPDAEREFSYALIEAGVPEAERLEHFKELWESAEHLAAAVACLARTVDRRPNGKPFFDGDDMIERLMDQLGDHLEHSEARHVVEQHALQHLRMSDPILRNRAALRARRQTTGREIDAAIRAMPTAALEAAVS